MLHVIKFPRPVRFVPDHPIFPTAKSYRPNEHKYRDLRIRQAMGQPRVDNVRLARDSMCQRMWSARGRAHCALPRAGSLHSPALGRAQWRLCPPPIYHSCAARRCAHASGQPVDVPTQVVSPWACPLRTPLGRFASLTCPRSCPMASLPPYHLSQLGSPSMCPCKWSAR